MDNECFFREHTAYKKLKELNPGVIIPESVWDWIILYGEQSKINAQTSSLGFLWNCFVKELGKYEHSPIIT